MGIADKFFFEDEYENIRLNINDEMFDEIIEGDEKTSKEMMLILCTELFRELDELSNELLKFKLEDDVFYLVALIKRNYGNYMVNQNRIIKKIGEFEGEEYDV